MKRKFLRIVSLFVVMALAACGPKPAPELSVTDVQNTAVALALTGIAMTPSAIPTNSPVPPTPIPITEAATLAILPTLALETPIAAPITNSNASPTPDCYQPAPVPAKLEGTTVEVRFKNRAGGPVDLSMGMYQPNEYGECFTFAFSLSDKGSDVVTILSGCYWISGYQNGPKPSTPRADYLCLDDTTQTRSVTINENTIGLD